MRTDLNICSTKACSDKHEIALQNGEQFSCEHFNLITSETHHLPLKSFSVADIKNKLSENRLGEDTSTIVQEYLSNFTNDKVLGMEII